MQSGPPDPVVPELDPHESILLQAALDERFFRIWEHERVTGSARQEPIYIEIDGHVGSIIEQTGVEALTSWARTQQPLMRGYSFRGPETYDPGREGPRPAAVYALERQVWRTIRELEARSAFDPRPNDRTYANVPGLFAALDKRHLLTLAEENLDTAWSSDPMLLFGDHALFAHPLVRDNRELVADVLSLVGVAATDIRLAVHPHAVVPIEARQHVGLFDYWYGVMVDEASLDDPHAVGHTRHERPVDRHHDYGFPLVAVDVYWSVDGDLKTVSVTETVPAPADAPPAGLVFNRFLHAIRDWRQGQWVHVDGAVKAYDVANYEPTVANPAAATGEPVAYRKLWRIDGVIDDKDWGRLLGHHFRDNELVIEAFGSILDERSS